MTIFLIVHEHDYVSLVYMLASAFMYDHVCLCHLDGSNTVYFQAKRLLISTRRILLSVIYPISYHSPQLPLLHNTGYIQSERAPTKIYYYKMPFNIRDSGFWLSNLLRIRVLQAVLATIYVILICYSSVHRGWWLNLLRPLVFGGMCS